MQVWDTYTDFIYIYPFGYSYLENPGGNFPLWVLGRHAVHFQACYFGFPQPHMVVEASVKWNDTGTALGGQSLRFRLLPPWKGTRRKSSTGIWNVNPWHLSSTGALLSLVYNEGACYLILFKLLCFSTRLQCLMIQILIYGNEHCTSRDTENLLSLMQR